MLRPCRFLLWPAANSATATKTKPSFVLKPITTHDELNLGLRLAADVFSKEEGLSVVKGVTSELFYNFFQGLHKSLDESAAKGLHLSFLAVEEGEGCPPRVGASFLVFPASMKHVDESVTGLESIGALLDHLFLTAEQSSAAGNTSTPNAIATPITKHLPTPLANKDDDTTVWFGIAAVSEFARGQGLQKLAKTKVIETARTHGFKSMITECTSSASAKSMMADVGLGTTAHARVVIPYADYNNGEFRRCVTDFGCDAAVLVEELF